jgi:hypothetical protein
MRHSSLLDLRKNGSRRCPPLYVDTPQQARVRVEINKGRAGAAEFCIHSIGTLRGTNQNKNYSRRATSA